MFRTMFEGTQTMLKLAYLNKEELKNVNGRYFDDNGKLYAVVGEADW